MPIHDWTRASVGGFHNFHQDWTIEIYRTLNRGILPEGFAAYTDLRVGGWEPDVVAIKNPIAGPSSGRAVIDAPPRAWRVARVESEPEAYARKANRIVVRHDYGRVVAVIEVMSPGNKSGRLGFGWFVAKALDFLRNGVNLVVVDLFPPTARDPGGIHQAIWENLTDDPFDPRPPDKPLTVASYDAADGLTAYVDPLAVGDPLPDAPLFLGPGWYVSIPLESTYLTCWEGTPAPIRDAVG